MFVIVSQTAMLSHLNVASYARNSELATPFPTAVIINGDDQERNEELVVVHPTGQSCASVCLFWLWLALVPAIFFTCAILFIPNPEKVCPHKCYEQFCSVTDPVPDQGRNFSCTCEDGGLHCEDKEWKDGKDGSSKLVIVILFGITTTFFWTMINCSLRSSRRH